MKTNKNLTRWLGLVLAGGIITFTASVEAVKPVKPPPPPPEPTLTYTLVPFDNGQRLNSWANGITESGLVPGLFDYEVVWNGQTIPLFWPTIATVTDANDDGLLDLPLPLPVLEGHGNGVAYMANEPGVIIGYTGRLVEDSEWPPLSVFEEGVVWVPEGDGYAAQGLGVIDGRLHQSYAHGVNNSGVVVGGCSWGNTVNWHRAFIIVPEDTADGPTWFRDADADGVNDLMLPVWPGPDPLLVPAESGLMDPVAYIVGINDDGVVAGNIDIDYAQAHPGVFVIVPDCDDADGDGNPWFAADAKGYNSLLQGLPPLSDGVFTVPSDINSSGEVAGSSDNHVVIWRPDGSGGYSIQDLGSFRQRDHLRAIALSDTGWLIARAYNLGTGASWPKNNPKPDLTLVWRHGVMFVLQDILTNGEGWTDLSFSDMNNEGVLAGHGTFDGKVTACLAVPSLP